MKSSHFVIRPATLADARQVIELISFADEHALLYLTGKGTLAEAQQVYLQGFGREDVYYSYLFTQVCFINERLAGCILAFPGFLEPTFISQAVSVFADVREADDDELYIDSLAVYPEFRGQQLSEKLIEAAKIQAKTYALGKLSLLADDTKPHLEKMYKSYGFAVANKIILEGVSHKKMTLLI
ncbi:GNAT family N-acetyltransferase [Rouxiella sp. T17]|uniref:GNAT family N-acetyltransferase n=1 Tax=Rouxiella sp. T17 TaxID=3085684 RepID=UPI002FCC2C44